MMSNLNRNILWFIGAALLIAIGYYFSNIVMYILIAWVLSMLGRPIMVFLQKRVRIKRYHLGPTGAALLTIMSFYALVFGLIMLFVPTIVEQARNLSTVDYETLGEKLKEPFFHLDRQMHQIGLLSDGESLATRTQELLSTWFKPTLVGDFLGTFISAAGNVFVTLASVTFILFFFLKENNLFLEILHALVPNELESKVRHAVQKSSNMLGRYFGGLAVQIFLFSLMIALVLWFFDIKNALLIGAFGGLFNVIPYIGPVLGIAFGSFIMVSSNLDTEFVLLWPKLLKMAGTFVVVHLIDSNLMGPAIFSKSVRAHPLEIFVVTLMAAKLGGMLGMVLGIPVYTVLRVIAHTFFNEFKLVQRLTERLDQETDT